MRSSLSNLGFQFGFVAKWPKLGCPICLRLR